MDVFAAIAKGDLAELNALLDADRSLASARDQHGVSAVLQALYHGKREAKDALVAAGAEIGIPEAAALGDTERLRAAGPAAAAARGADGFTALHLAAFFGGPEAVRVLLEAGADAHADAENPFHVHPLHSAAAVGNRDGVKALLEAGADPNVRQEQGFTALHTAAHNDDAEPGRLLLAPGADPSLADDDGKTPADMAKGDALRALLA